MVTLTIRNLDEDVRRRLKVLAAQHDRSMEAEVRAILTAAVTASPAPELSAAQASTAGPSELSALTRADPALTPREEQVAALIEQGMSNRRIAATLYLSERTVETHVCAILRKLGFHSRARVAAWHATQAPST